jgi:hypothetical protein
VHTSQKKHRHTRYTPTNTESHRITYTLHAFKKISN